MKILDKYIAKQILISIFAVLGVLVIVVGLLDLVDEIKKVNSEYSIILAFTYVILNMPQKVYEVLPIATLMGSLIGLSKLSSTSELNAAKSCGLSFIQITLITLKTGMVIVILTFLIGEFIAPKGQQLANNVKNIGESTRLSMKNTDGIWIKSNNSFIHIAKVYPNKIVQEISLYSITPSILSSVSISAVNLFIFFTFIAGNFVPFQILMIPVRDFTFQIGLYDTVTGLVLFHVAFQTGFCTLFMRNFIKALPNELFEAARMDGTSEFNIFLKIVLPLTRPAIAALCVLIFTFIWNDFFWATVLIQGHHAMPITAGLKSLNGQWISAYHLLSAGSIMAAIPPVIMFFLMQKHFIAGLTLGASKG